MKWGFFLYFSRQQGQQMLPKLGLYGSDMLAYAVVCHETRKDWNLICDVEILGSSLRSS